MTMLCCQYLLPFLLGTPPPESRDISSWLAESKVVTPNAAGRGWAERNHDSVLKRKTAYEPKWVGKADRPVLRVEDGSAPVAGAGIVPAAERVAE